jgi:hypothetical protein
MLSGVARTVQSQNFRGGQVPGNGAVDAKIASSQLPEGTLLAVLYQMPGIAVKVRGTLEEK